MRVSAVIALAVALAAGTALGASESAPAVELGGGLARLPYAAQALTAYDGYVVFSQSDASGGRWRLMVWHAGGGTCFSINPLSPNQVGGGIVYARKENDCEHTAGSPGFQTSRFEPRGVAPAGGGFIAAVARDGASTYWLRAVPADPTVADDYAAVCDPGISSCTLVRSTAIAGRRAAGDSRR
jgi:hypothetical protein